MVVMSHSYDFAKIVSTASETSSATLSGQKVHRTQWYSLQKPCHAVTFLNPVLTITVRRTLHQDKVGPRSGFVTCMVCSEEEMRVMSNENPKAIIRMTGDDVFSVTTPSGNTLTVDTDSKRHSAPSPKELLLVALGSCTAVDVVSILRKKRQNVTDYRVEVRGERRDEHPRSYKRMEVHHIVTGRNISERSVAQAIALSEEKYCSVAATLRPTAAIVSTYEVIEGEEHSAVSNQQSAD